VAEYVPTTGRFPGVGASLFNQISQKVKVWLTRHQSGAGSKSDCKTCYEYLGDLYAPVANITTAVSIMQCKLSNAHESRQEETGAVDAVIHSFAKASSSIDLLAQPPQNICVSLNWMPWNPDQLTGLAPNCR